MKHNEDLVGHFIDEKCPKCGAMLLGNKRGDKWCSNVGGAGMSACDYGLSDSITNLLERKTKQASDH